MLTASGEIKLSNERLEALGDYYTASYVWETTAITFEQFLNLHERGRWHERVV